MKKKLSPYWWCQISGWGAFAFLGAFFYFFVPGFTGFDTFSSVIATALLGLFTSHLMRQFIVKVKLLNLKLWKQFVLLLLTTILFSFIYYIFQWWWLLFKSALHNTVKYNFWESALFSVFLNSQFFAIWSLIYLTYHYIRKSRKEQIERIRFETELKIRQLETEKAQMEFERNLAEISLTALRFQMNPHFIFNCLNSIKLYTTQNNTQAASEYLTKFSKLIRLVMENSNKEKILLSNELDMLRLYIDMEAMRFKEKLQYTICVDKKVEADYTEVPPLLLQPYVENAIWHGLMPKENGGRIDIDVAMNNKHALLEIGITDNGVGRAKSEEARSRTTLKHTSYGMKVTSERIALINRVYKTNADVTVHDLTDENGIASGTTVIIKIPV